MVALNFNSKLPSLYPKRVLLVLAGSASQIVTETLYGLIVNNKTPFIPTEIQLLTTAKEYTKTCEILLAENRGMIKRFCDDYQLKEIPFSKENIHLIKDKHGIVLEDVINPEDNECAADMITEQIRTITQDPQTALHVSMTGGRRSLSFYACSSLMLFARSQDRLSHVLVSREFEFLPDFFYPTPYEYYIHSQNIKAGVLNAADALITLMEVPFVQLRQGMPSELLQGHDTFSQSIAVAQKKLEPISLSLHIKQHQICCGSTLIQLKPAEFAFYYWLAERRKNNLPDVRWTDEDIHSSFLLYYEKVVGLGGYYIKAEQLLSNGMTKGYFEQRRSKANAPIIKALGKLNATPYLISTSGKRPELRYGLVHLQNESICIND